MRSSLIAFVLLGICAVAQTRPAQSTTAATGDSSAKTAAPSPGIDPAKKNQILRFMQLTGGEEISTQLTKQMETSLRPMLENSLPPGEYRTKLIDLFVAKFGPRLTQDLIMPVIESVYDRHFTVDELTQLIAFYESPLGRKAASVLPDIDAQRPAMQDAADKLGEKCMAEVLAENPDLERAMEKAEKANPVH